MDRKALDDLTERMRDIGMQQVGWRSTVTGEVCDCPVYELSPHAQSDPVFAPSLVTA